jgi:hypothetical protein
VRVVDIDGVMRATRWTVAVESAVSRQLVSSKFEKLALPEMPKRRDAPGMSTNAAAPALLLLVLLVGGGIDFAGPFGTAPESRAPECQRDRDCDDDEECDGGECVEEDDSGRAGEGEGEGEGEGDRPPHPEGPRYLQFSTNTTELHQDESVIVTAVLTDPDGVDDLIGGSLLDPGGASYGAFATSAAEGSYELTLSWDEIDAVAPIDFATSLSRTFQAKFFDVAGHEAIRSFSLTLACDSGGPACDGTCGGARCGDGSCTASRFGDDNGNAVCGDQCRNLFTTTDCGKCDEGCAEGQQCVTGDEVGALPGFAHADALCSCSAASCGGTSICVGGLLDNSSTKLCVPGETELTELFNGVLYLSGYVDGELCDMSPAEITMLCQSVGFESGVSAGIFRAGVRAMAVDCAGASTVRDCVFTYEESCDVPRVQCSDSIGDNNPGDGQIRLVGGGSAREGRVEISFGGVFGTVCDDRWNSMNAQVVCRQLGFSGGTTHMDAFFGPGRGPIQLDEVVCTGSESRLVDCSANAVGNNNCDHGDDVAVTCN